MTRRRVVVTGLGLISPVGNTVEEGWAQLVAGRSGITQVTRFDASALSCRIAGEVKGFDVERVMPAKEARHMDTFIHYGIAAAAQAVADAGLPTGDALNEESAERIGVMIGSGIGGLPGITEGAITLKEKGLKRISPFFIPSNLINLASGHVSIKYGFQGPNHAVVTACSTGAHAIGDATRLIQLDDADVMVAGGTEAAICRIGMAGFARANALSTNFNDTPERASRPWDKDRDGFVMGEGSGIVVLEELEHARKRGARIYGEVVGYGLSGDAHHVTAPAEDGSGGFRAMRMALKRAKLNVEDIDSL